jgi:hypothetical protein
MTVPALLTDVARIDEPNIVGEYSNVLSKVAAEERPVIVRRNGADLAAVIPMHYLDLINESLARLEVEKLASSIDWKRVEKASGPPQEWFDETENPFEPEEAPVP